MRADTVVFPGQGSQQSGMSLDFASRFDEAKSVLDRASEVLGYDVFAQIRDEDGTLNLTEYTQPCLLAAELAIFRVLASQGIIAPRYFGGHSLGEFSALVAAGAIPLDEEIRLVQTRGKLMQLGAPADGAEMAALILPELPIDRVRQVAGAFDVDVANYNSLDQVVISGPKPGVASAVTALNEQLGAQGLRSVLLAVSAPFHSRHMKEAGEHFGKVLERAQDCFLPEKARAVVSNYTGTFHTGERSALVESLTLQISSPVRWIENMRALASHTQTILELGPGRPLSGFFRTLGIAVPSIGDLRTLVRTFPEMKEPAHTIGV